MEYKYLIVKKENRVATIILNRPEKLNGLNVEMTHELIDLFNEVARDDSIRVLIITGAGRAFSVGADLSSSDFTVESAGEAYQMMKTATQIIMGIRNLPKPVIAAVNGAMMKTATQIIMGIRNLPKPVIAAVNGAAVGGGTSLAIACDIILASDKAKFSEIFISRGLHPDWGSTYFLPRLIGAAKARELMLTGRMVDAAEAEKIGLISRVVPGDQLEKVSLEMALNLAKLSPLALGMIKNSLNNSLEMDLSKNLENEAKAQSILFLTEDFRESVAAFFEKKEYLFKGK